MLEEQIMNDFKQAMKNKEAIRTSTLSLLRSQLKYVLIEKKTDKLSDPDVIAERLPDGRHYSPGH